VHPSQAAVEIAVVEIDATFAAAMMRTAPSAAMSITGGCIRAVLRQLHVIDAMK
jgi:hypothetical protein